MLIDASAGLTDGIAVELREFHLSEPLETIVTADDHQIAFFLPPAPLAGEIRALGRSANPFRLAKPMRFRPAGVNFELRGLAGHNRLLRTSFSRRRLADALDEDIFWREEEIERGLDLSTSGIAPLLMRMLGEVTNPGLGGHALLDAMSTMMMIELVRHLRGHERSPSGGRMGRRLQQRISERVETDELPPPTVNELARLCGMSERNLLRLFRSNTGETASGYIRRILVARARRYLAGDDLPLREIAVRLGYAQPSAFIAAYRKETGETPDSFRRNMRRGDR